MIPLKGKLDLEKIQKVNEFEYKVKCRVPIRIFADDEIIKTVQLDFTINQLKGLANLDGILGHVAVMPDVHEAYCMPVGSVVAMDAKKGMICPGGIGYDINCGIRMLKTNLEFKEIRNKLAELADALYWSIPLGVGNSNNNNVKLTFSELDEVLLEGASWAVKKGYGNSNDLEMCENNGQMQNATLDAVSKRAKLRGISQLGTLGTGNHFLEIQKVVEIHDESAAKQMGIRLGQITVMIHCGSRGLGHQVCNDYVTTFNEMTPHENPLHSQLACMPFTSQQGQRYYCAMAASANYAWANRQILTHIVRRAFKHVLNLKDSDIELVYDLSHNIAKLESHKINGVKK